MKSTDSARRVSKEELVRRFRTEGILSAAREVISRRGIHGASLGEIASEAGVAKGTIYLYFANKDDLFCRVFDCFCQQLLEDVKHASSSNGSASQRLQAVVRAHLDFINRHIELVEGYFFEGGSGARKFPKGLSRNLRAMHRRYEEIVAGILKEGIRSGEFRKVNVCGAASFLVEMLQAEHLRLRLEKEPFTPEGRALELLDLYFYGVIK
jgi:AcrR family transcriptional regulator